MADQPGGFGIKGAQGAMGERVNRCTINVLEIDCLGGIPGTLQSLPDQRLNLRMLKALTWGTCRPTEKKLQDALNFRIDAIPVLKLVIF
jgi:hypothetical protein